MDLPLTAEEAHAQTMQLRWGPNWRDREKGSLPKKEPVASDKSTDVAPINGAQLLDKVVQFLRTYVVMDATQADAVALWCLHAHALEAFDVSPRLVITSPEMRSGKTLLLELISMLVPKPMLVLNVSEPALFRSLKDETLTLLHDEVDATFGPRARDREDLRALLNGGWQRGATVRRVVGEGKKMRVESFPAFCPVALAGIGDLPATIMDRAIVIRMKRRTPAEPAERCRRRDVRPQAEVLLDELAAWAAQHVDALHDAEPSLPDELHDRAADAWEPPLAIADALGGPCSERARYAAKVVSGLRPEDDGSLGVRLLADIACVFDGADRLPSADLLQRLASIETAPWGDWYKGRPITAQRLAKLLSPFGVRPEKVWFPDREKALQGYERASFSDAFSRYLPSSDPQPRRSEEPRSDGVFAVPAPGPKSAPDQHSSNLPPLDPEEGAEGDVGEWDGEQPEWFAELSRCVDDDEAVTEWEGDDSDQLAAEPALAVAAHEADDETDGPFDSDDPRRFRSW